MDDEQGTLLRVARESAGVSLAALAAKTHFSKSYLGMLETGQRAVQPEHVRAYETALGIDVERLAAVAAAPRRVDRASLAEVAAMLRSTRRIEDAAGAATVMPAVQGLAAMTRALTTDAGALTSETVSLASEIVQYRGWLEIASGHARTADRSFDTAVEMAAESDDPERLTHGLSFKAYNALERGDTATAADLTDAALAVDNVHPLIRLYDRYQRARVHAAAGEARAAELALVAADTAAEAASDEEPPEAGYWYTPGLWGLHRGRVLWLVGRHEQARREVRDGLAAMPPAHREADWARKWVAAATGAADVPN